MQFLGVQKLTRIYSNYNARFYDRNDITLRQGELAYAETYLPLWVYLGRKDRRVVIRRQFVQCVHCLLVPGRLLLQTLLYFVHVGCLQMSILLVLTVKKFFFYQNGKNNELFTVYFCVCGWCVWHVRMYVSGEKNMHWIVQVERAL